MVKRRLRSYLAALTGTGQSAPAIASPMPTAAKSEGGIRTILPLSPTLDIVSARVGKLVTLHNDLGVSECIRTTGAWAAHDLEIFSSLIQRGMFVVDVGAYIGHHTVYFSQLVGPEGLVVAFEPQRVPFRVLNTNLLLNGCDNVEAFNFALGAEPQISELWPHKEKDNFGAVPLVVKQSGAVPEITYRGQTTYGRGGQSVEISTLDIMLSRFQRSGRKLGFIKIDVQAFEIFVLRGASNILKTDRPIVFFEVSPYWMDRLMGYDYRDLYALLEGYGYRVVDAHGDHSVPTQRRWSGDEDEEWDCLAFPQ